MIFRSYVDEAGLSEKQRYVSLAGYVAPACEWEKFERDWSFVLSEFMRGIPEPSHYFHAKEFYQNREPYRSWSSSKRRSFEDALFKAIADRDVAVYMSCVDREVFFSMTEDERRYLTGGIHNGMKWVTWGAPTKPYFLPFQFCIIQAAKFVRETDTIFPIMSRQEEYKMHALGLYEQMLGSYPALLCRPKLADDMVFSDPKKVGALQAADLAVYWFSQMNEYFALMNTRDAIGFPDRLKIKKLLRNLREFGDLKTFDFEGLMVSLGNCNRYIKTSFPTLDQRLPSLPLAQRKEVLGVMRRINLRRFLDHETLILPASHG